MTEITWTLDEIRKADPCAGGWRDLNKHLGSDYGGDTPISMPQLISALGLQDALWCLRTKPEHDRLWRHYAVDCAETAKHLLTDDRSLNALIVARRHAAGRATDEELAEAWEASWASASGASAAACAACAACAARAAEGAKWAAARAGADVGELERLIIKRCETSPRHSMLSLWIILALVSVMCASVVLL